MDQERQYGLDQVLHESGAKAGTGYPNFKHTKYITIKVLFNNDIIIHFKVLIRMLYHVF